MKEEGSVKDFSPLEWERKWDCSGGNNKFGVDLRANMKLEGKENYLNINSLFYAGVSLFGEEIDALKIEAKNTPDKKGYQLNGYLLGNKVYNKTFSTSIFNDIRSWKTDWSIPLIFPIGPIEVAGEIGFKGEAGFSLEGQVNPGAHKIKNHSLSFSQYRSLCRIRSGL